ncbi:MAG: hypothetical protein K1X81_09245 [Bacteroidia bacterium]|nr:hypothetical protein [Bacteroidia bacterium]
MKRVVLFFACIGASFASIAQNLDNWTQLGMVKFPDNPSVQTTGMGRVSELVYHPADSNTLFAVSASGGLWKSSNEAQTWKSLTDKLPRTACASVCLNKWNPNTIYLGTGDANYNSTGMGVWKSIDGGKTWFQSNSGMGNKLVSKMLMHPADSNTLIAACSDGIYKTYNGGSTWTKKTTVTASYRDLVIKARSGTQILYAATDGNFYRSYDMGENWISSNIYSGLTPAGIKIGVSPADSQVLYCVVWKSTGNRFGGLYKSVDDGNSFTLQSDTPNILGYSSNGSTADGQGAYNLCIAVDPVNINTIYVGAICIWKSTNSGASWTLKSHWAYGVHADKHCFVFSPYNPNKLIITHDGGLDRTVNGGNTWTTLSDGLSASEFYKMGQSMLRKEIVIGGLQDNGLNIYRNGVFATIKGGDWTGDFTFDYRDTNVLYFNGGNRKFVNGGEESINGSGIYTLNASDTNMMFYATTEVYRTTNLKASPSTNVSWTQISNSLGGTNTPTITTMAYNAAGACLYVGRNDGSLFRSDNITSATPSFAQLTKPSGNIGQILVHQRDPNFVIIIIGTKIYRSSNKGQTWTDISMNLPALNLVKVLVDEYSADTVLYAANALGVYYTKRYLPYWSSFSASMPTIAPISDMEIYRDTLTVGNSRLRMSTYGRGIWQTDLFNQVATKPTADFSYYAASASCSPYYFLNDISTGTPSSRRWTITPATGWSFINGSDSSYRVAEIKFNAPGNYLISLTVSNSSGTSVKSVPMVISTLGIAASCVPSTANLGGYTIGIYRFEMNTIDKSSGYSVNANPNIEDYSCNVSTTVKPGGVYTAAITNGNSYNETGRVYIDYNNNGIFETTELACSFTSGQGRRTATITIPSNPAVVNTYLRMRVISDYSALTGACGPLSYGQAEDYALLIDTVKPIVSISVPKPQVNQSFTATFTLNKYVTAFNASAVSVQNGILSNISQTGPLTYTALVVPAQNGKVKLTVAAGKLTDMAGNTNNAVSDSTVFFLGFNSFTFPGLSIKDSLSTSITGGRIDVTLPYGTNLTALISRFTTSANASAKIGGIKQTSDVSAADFSSVVSYVLKSADSLCSNTWNVYVKIQVNRQCSLLTFASMAPAVNSNITHTANGGTVQLVLPFGTPKTNLVTAFTLSDSATAYIGSVKQISGSTANNFTNTVTYTIKAQDTSYKCYYYVQVSEGLSNLCDMLSYSIVSPAASGTINGTVITANVPFGTPLTSLVAAFTISDSATIKVNTTTQVSGSTANNFSDTVKYEVTAQNGINKKIYSVKVNTLPNTSCELLTFYFTGPTITGVITPTAGGGYVHLTVPFGTDIRYLASCFTISDSARIKINGVIQSCGLTRNFTDTVFYDVVAQDGVHTKTYAVIVKVTPNTDCDLLTYKLTNPLTNAVITQTTGGGNVDLVVSPSVNLSSLIAAFTVSDSAKATVNGVPQQSGITANNYTSPFTFTVTSQNGAQAKNYTVTVTYNTGVFAATAGGMAKVVPNPSDGNFHFMFQSNYSVSEPVLVRVVDILGREVFKEKVLCSPSGNTCTHRFDLSTQPKGIYLLKFEQNGTEGILRICVK